ncbi:MAG: signal peptidase I [Ruminococcaceae bacterium]|nr:signal peptidase I [Oscillospiraceae bacterium]
MFKRSKKFMVNEKKNSAATKKDKVLTGIGIALCVILLPILIINCTLIVKSYVNKDEVPTFGGYCPLIVLTESMDPIIKSGDLIICESIDPKEVKVGDIISFFDPEGNGTSIVTHQVIEILEDGTFRTKGTNNNTEDSLPVPLENFVGIYRSRIAGAGNIALFLQSTPGLIICIGLPIILIVGFDFLRRRKYEKAKQQDTDALLAELEALRAQKAQSESAVNEAGSDKNDSNN